MSKYGLSEKQIVAILEKLPASCVFDAVDGIVPVVSVNVARFFLLEWEQQKLITWNRNPPQEISLTQKGQSYLARKK